PAAASTASAQRLMAFIPSISQQRRAWFTRHGVPRSGEGDGDLLGEVHGLLHATFHAGVDVAVPGFLAGVLDQHGERGTPVLLDERRGVHGVVIGNLFVHLSGNEPLVRDDLAVLAVEPDDEATVRGHHVAPRAADAEVDLDAVDGAALTR